MPHLLRKLVAPLGVRAVRLHGDARTGGGPLEAVYLGSGTNLAFLTAHFFGSYEQRPLYRRAHPLRLTAGMHSAAGDVDLVFTEQPPLWSRLIPASADVTVPAWIRQQLTLPATPANGRGLLPRLLEKEVRRLQGRHQYSLQIEQAGDALLREFYRAFYLPHVQRRFGAGAVTVAESDFLRIGRGLELARLYAGERWVAGMLVRGHGRMLRLGWFGLADGPPAPGASEVLDALCIQHWYRRGMRTVHMGNSRPCTTDGVVRYKRRFGAAVSATRFPQPMLGIGVRRWTPAVRDVLQAHPLIALRDGEPCTVRVSDGRDGPALVLQPMTPTDGRPAA